MFNPGAIIGTHYKVVRLLGQGGMSNIYLCEDTHLFNKVWAVKEFTATYADPQEQANALGSFEREARLLSALSHPNLPTINEYFQFQGHYYLAMEYLKGKDLGKIIEENNGPLPEMDVVDWGTQMATVLYYLHCQKPVPIIFRDVKPSNIIILDGMVKLIDFGIARLFTPGKRGDTMRIGSPGYAPPEQYNGQTDQRSDIYALGVTLHQAITGKDPTLSPNPFVIPPVLTINPQASPQLAAIIEKSTQLVPEDRYQSMLEVKRDLRNLLMSKRGMRGMTTPNMGAVPPNLMQATAPFSVATNGQTAPQGAPVVAANQLPPSNAAAQPGQAQPSAPSNVQTLAAPAADGLRGRTSVVSPASMPPTSIPGQSEKAVGPGSAGNQNVPTTDTSVANNRPQAPPVIVTVDGGIPEDSFGSKVKRFLFLTASWGITAACAAVIVGLWTPWMPTPAPLTSSATQLTAALLPKQDGLPPLSVDNYRSIYQYAPDRLAAVKALDDYLAKHGDDLPASLQRLNLDVLKSQYALEEETRGGQTCLRMVDKSSSKSASQHSNTASRASSFKKLTGAANTIAVIVPESPEAGAPVLRGVLAAQKALQNYHGFRGQGVMINPIVEDDLRQIDFRLSSQIFADAPMPQPNTFNSQAILSLTDVSSIWQGRSKIQAPKFYTKLDNSSKSVTPAAVKSSSVKKSTVQITLPTLADTMGVSVQRNHPTQPFYTLDIQEIAPKLAVLPQATNSKEQTPSEPEKVNSGDSAGSKYFTIPDVLIPNAKKITIKGLAEQKKGTVFITLGQYLAAKSSLLEAKLPKSLQIVIIVPWIEALKGETQPDAWVKNGQLQVWSLLSYAHPHSQAVELLNTGIIDTRAVNIASAYAQLQAADAFTLEAVGLRNSSGVFKGVLAKYDSGISKFETLPCQSFDWKADGLHRHNSQ
ncbi:MAG: protein kinase [bacterium]|nr:protein kinase [bacterium]